MTSSSNIFITSTASKGGNGGHAEAGANKG